MLKMFSSAGIIFVATAQCEKTFCSLFTLVRNAAFSCIFVVINSLMCLVWRRGVNLTPYCSGVTFQTWFAGWKLSLTRGSAWNLPRPSSATISLSGHSVWSVLTYFLSLDNESLSYLIRSSLFPCVAHPAFNIPGWEADAGQGQPMAGGTQCNCYLD